MQKDGDSSSSSSSSTTTPTTTTTTTTTTTPTTTIEEKDDGKMQLRDEKRNEETSPTLEDPEALDFWQTCFGEKNYVSNKEFKNNLRTHIKKNNLLDIDDLNGFLVLVVERIFWPDYKLYADDVDVTTFVDTHCLQFAINTFGSWKKNSFFPFLHDQFHHPDLVSPILNFFHGRSRVWKDNLNDSRQYLVRFRLKGKKVKKKNRGGLVICWTNEVGVTSTSEVVRKPRYKTKDGEWHPAGWSWTEEVPVIGKTRLRQRKSESFQEFLSEHRYNKQFGQAVMYGSDYVNAMEKRGPSEEELANLVDKHVRAMN